jgi:hypothetical protein
MKRGLALTLIFLFVISLWYSDAQSKKEKVRILFIGNSYTYFGNLPQIVAIISDQTAKKLVTKKSVAGGASLSEHWRGERGLQTREIIEHGKYDIVVLQDHSMAALNQPDTLRKYVRLFCDLIKKSKAKPYLYITWAREKDPQNQETISKVYREAAKENDAEVVPVGEAWALALKEKPDFDIYDSDGSHPTKLGTFLAACVFSEVFLSQIPRELPTVYNINDSDGEYVMLMYIEAEDAAFCRHVASSVIYNK